VTVECEGIENNLGTELSNQETRPGKRVAATRKILIKTTSVKTSEVTIVGEDGPFNEETTVA